MDELYSNNIQISMIFSDPEQNEALWVTLNSLSQTKACLVNLANQLYQGSEGP